MHPQNAGMSLVPVRQQGDREVACMEDFSDLYQAGLALEQLLGNESSFTEGFDPDRDAGREEREVLRLIIKVLRPASAPSGLLKKCLALIEGM